MATIHTIPTPQGRDLLPICVPADGRILVIKLGALGDFVHAMHAFATLRAHHAGQHLTLLTTAPFAQLSRDAPWFDEVLIDERAPWWNLPALRRTIRQIRGFDFVYDLQTSGRSTRYFDLAGRPPWSGIAPGCSHPHANPDRDYLHTLERQREQLQFAGITRFVAPDRQWLIRQGNRHNLAEPYALLMPGGAGVGSAKRWPAERYAEVARFLAGQGLTPAVIGGTAEAALAHVILGACPGAVNLTGRTSIADIAALGARAALVLGNDTGPVHLAAAVGAPTVALFSSAGIPNQAAPRGPNGEWVPVLHTPKLTELTVDSVIAALMQERRLPAAKPRTPSSAPVPPPGSPQGQNRRAKNTSRQSALK
jgi:ADP-heptose:LPS heptosyltransferase